MSPGKLPCECYKRERESLHTPLRQPEGTELRLAAIERETIINVNAKEDRVYVYSAEPKVWRHFARLGLQPTAEHSDGDGQIYARDYEVPRSWLRLPKPPKRMNFTAEQKAAAASRLKKGRARAHRSQDFADIHNAEIEN